MTDIVHLGAEDTMADHRKNALPCPFCGSRNLATPPGFAIVICETCRATGPQGKSHPTIDGLSELSAYRLWNRRIEPFIHLRECEAALRHIADSPGDPHQELARSALAGEPLE